MSRTKREFKDNVTKNTEDTRFYIASIEPNAKKTSKAVRQHTLHWTLDMTFRKDESRIRTEAATENFAIMRHIALNLIKNDTSRKASVKHVSGSWLISEKPSLGRCVCPGNEPSFGNFIFFFI